jgi:hypothetical protein
MRRFATFCVLVVLTQWSPLVWANSLPETIGYTIFNRGHEVGHSQIDVTQTATEIVFESTTRVQFTAADSMSVTSRTVADPQTFLIRSFEYDGIRGPSTIHAEVTVYGDSLHYLIDRNGEITDDYKKSPYEYNLMLEDYIMEHEVLIALSHNARVEGTSTPAHYGVLFPLGAVMTSADIVFASDLEIESDTESAVCKKLVIKISGSEPFATFFDPERGLPVYMAFPQTLVEVFLDDFFGDSPVTRYRGE